MSAREKKDPDLSQNIECPLEGRSNLEYKGQTFCFFYNNNKRWPPKQIFFNKIFDMIIDFKWWQIAIFTVTSIVTENVKKTTCNEWTDSDRGF